MPLKGTTVLITVSLALSRRRVLATSALAQNFSEQSEAQITDFILECTPYDYAPTNQFSNKFPAVFAPASLLLNDIEAVWANISSLIPTNILPKVQINGSTINVTYNTALDPDCWWTVSHCTTPKIPWLTPDVSSVPEPRTMG